MLKPPKGLMTWEEYGAYMEAAFADFIRPKIAVEIGSKMRRLVGSASPLRGDHPEFGLAMRLFRYDRAVAAKNFRKKKP